MSDEINIRSLVCFIGTRKEQTASKQIVQADCTSRLYRQIAPNKQIAHNLIVN